jgi:hypothetical protein
MPLEAASFIWLTPDPLQALADLHGKLKAEGLLASTLELDESQLDTLSKDAALKPLLETVEKAVKADDAAAVVKALRAGPRAAQKLNVYFRLEQPAKLTGKVREAYEKELGEPPPLDKLGMAPIAPFEAWAVFALDDLDGTRVVEQSAKQKRSKLDSLSVPVWRLEDKAGDGASLGGKTSLELRSLSDDAAYLAFALERVGAWNDGSTVLLRSL